MEIKPGKYIAKVVEGKIDKSKEKGTPYFGIKFAIGPVEKALEQMQDMNDMGLSVFTLDKKPKSKE